MFLARIVSAFSATAIVIACSPESDQANIEFNEDNSQPSVSQPPRSQANDEVSVTDLSQTVSSSPTAPPPSYETVPFSRIDAAVLEAEAASRDDFELERSARLCASGEREIGSEFCQRLASEVSARGSSRVPPVLTSSPDCAEQARKVAENLCVNFVMRAFDDRMTLNSTAEAGKLPRSCHPIHTAKAIDGYEIGDVILERLFGQPNVTEGRVRMDCASAIKARAWQED